ncbi:MAG: hypothetical protein LBG13_01290 [Holosporales bacterium]|nr:hypothetical protein [Holosporales bacterium]
MGGAGECGDGLVGWAMMASEGVGLVDMENVKMVLETGLMRKGVGRWL